jgi:hypothetical protein
MFPFSPNRRLLGAVLLAWSAGVVLPRLAVVCVAPGGHVAIEPGRVACIDRDATEHAHELPAAGLGSDRLAALGACDDAPEGPCSDVPLGAQAFLRGALLAHSEPLFHAPASAFGGDAIAPECALSRASMSLVRHTATTVRPSPIETSLLRC